MEIVPAILTKDKNEFSDMFEMSEQFANMVQVDIMDGKFVPSESIKQEDLKGHKASKFVEAHLMVIDPLEWIDAFYEFGAKRIIFHLEVPGNKEKIIQKIRSRGLGVGIAVNPDTKIEDISNLVGNVDTVLFMSVVPGFYGSKFIPSVLDKIKEFSKIYPGKPVGIDGGVKLSNIEQIVSFGVEFICVGSALLKSEDSSKSYSEFIQYTK